MIWQIFPQAFAQVSLGQKFCGASNNSGSPAGGGGGQPPPPPFGPPPLKEDSAPPPPPPHPLTFTVAWGSRAYKLLVDIILATDMAHHGNLSKEFASAVENLQEGEVPPKLLTIKMIMKSSDLSNIVRPFHLSQRWAASVTEEFLAQGDQEKVRALRGVCLRGSRRGGRAVRATGSPPKWLTRCDGTVRWDSWRLRR